MLFLVFNNLDYSIGASASVIDQLMDIQPHIQITVIEPNRLDLPRTEVKLPKNVYVHRIPFPFVGILSFLSPFISFIFALKVSSHWKPDVIVSIHQPHHFLSLVGHLISNILHIPHIVDIRDVWRPMGLKLKARDRLFDIMERHVVKVIKNDLLVFVCRENKIILESRAKISFNHFIVWPNCVSYRLIRNIKSKKYVGGKNIQFIFVGRIAPEYGLHKIEPLLDYLSSLSYKPRILIIGYKQIDNLPKYATYIGILPREKTLKLIAESDIGIGPMYPTMAIPRKVVEYIVLGKIVIVGKNAISKNFLKYFKEYIIEVSEKENIEKIGNKILNLLQNNRNVINKKINILYCKERMYNILRKTKKTQVK